MVDLLGRAEQAEGVRIFIGSENKLFSLSGSSTITAPYRDAAGHLVGVLGVIGPTRLNYAREQNWQEGLNPVGNMWFDHLLEQDPETFRLLIAHPSVRPYLEALMGPQDTGMAGGAGDVIFMHYLTVHSGSANRSDRIRVGLNTAVMPDPFTSAAS